MAGGYRGHETHHHDSINDHFQHLKDHLNDNPDCHLELGYSEELAHLVDAGADLLVVPSMFEPCGLAPLIAMRYGTVPVVRVTGGMIDTVFDRDHSGRWSREPLAGFRCWALTQPRFHTRPPGPEAALLIGAPLTLVSALRGRMSSAKALRSVCPLG